MLFRSHLCTSCKLMQTSMDYKQCSLFAVFVCFTALAERQRLSANDKQCNLFAVFVCIFRIAERQRLSANDKQCSLFALFVYGHHAGSRCSANNDGFLKEIACGVVNIGARNNNLACFKAHLAGADRKSTRLNSSHAR